MGTVVPDTQARATGKTNALGLSLNDYKGAESTLCKGCGHDAISSSIMKAFYELGIPQYRIAKLSGIGCSSKTTNYFFNQSHGFNSVHGRMATIATGVAVANRVLVNVGISGDGDTASIGLGNFCHMVRRNVPLVYIVENNGCYGLTKGQMSATADKGSKMKGGILVEKEAIDLCAQAIRMGAGYVARSFSGDTSQVRNLIKGAASFNGTAFLDIISPCVTFNDHEGSTKSRQFARDHNDPLHEVDYIPHYEDITVEYEPGETRVVEMHNGAKVTLKKLKQDYDPTNRREALDMLECARDDGYYHTGLVYFNPKAKPIQEELNLPETPLVHLTADQIRPSKETFESIMAAYR